MWMEKGFAGLGNAVLKVTLITTRPHCDTLARFNYSLLELFTLNSVHSYEVANDGAQ